MNNGYQQFFKQANKVASRSGATTSLKNTSQSLGTMKTSVFNNKVNMNGNSQPKFILKKDSQEMTNNLRERMRRKSKKPVRKIPWKIVGISLVGVLIAFAGLNHANEVDQFLKRIEFSLMGKALAEEKSATKEGAVKEKDSHAKEREKNQEGKNQDSKGAEAAAAKKEFSDDEINHFGKLNERKRELDAREEELNRMEAELATQKIELDKRMTELDSTRRQISSVLEEKVKIDEKKVEALVQMYTSMKPQQSAKIFETMDEDLAIEILGRMKRKSAAEILNLLKAEKAQTLSEKYSGFKKH